LTCFGGVFVLMEWCFSNISSDFYRLSSFRVLCSLLSNWFL
jgi:hypothetical protein